MSVKLFEFASSETISGFFRVAEQKATKILSKAIGRDGSRLIALPVGPPAPFRTLSSQPIH